MTTAVVDLFAGPGGWDQGLKQNGRTDVVGIEWDEAACLTATKAGHLRIRADVENYPPERFAGYEGLIASPPCQDFSLAGRRAGRTGDKGRLIDTVPEWVQSVMPEWVVCEQVPPCLLIWREHASLYRELGYSAWCGVLNAADYGVPQTRKRAILIASRVRVVTEPEPTHDKTPVAGLFGKLEPWVTMAQALGWGFDSEPSCAVVAGGGETGGSEPFANAKYRARLQSFVASGVTGNGLPKDPETDPADTITGSGNAYWMSKKSWMSKNSLKVSTVEAGILQSFSADYPWQGSRKKQYQQIGNAIPPLFAAHILKTAQGIKP